MSGTDQLDQLDQQGELDLDLEDQEGNEGQLEEPEALWAEVAYESGRSGPILHAEGLLVDDHPNLVISDVNDGHLTIVGSAFLVSAVLTPLFEEDQDTQAQDAQDTQDTQE